MVHFVLYGVFVILCYDKIYHKGLGQPMTALITLAIISALATFIILMMGVMTIGKKGPENKARSNKLMRLRVFFQFSTVIFLLLAAAAAGTS